MSYPDPHHPQQQPPPEPYPPAPTPSSGPYGYGYPPNFSPNGGYPPAQPYGAHPKAPSTVPPQLDVKRDDGNSRIWRILDNLMFFATDASSQGLGNNARDRVKTSLVIFGIIFVAIAILIAVLAVMTR